MEIIIHFFVLIEKQDVFLKLQHPVKDFPSKVIIILTSKYLMRADVADIARFKLISGKDCAFCFCPFLNFINVFKSSVIESLENSLFFRKVTITLLLSIS